MATRIPLLGISAEKDSPSEAYLASLSPGSRPVMRAALALIADILSDGNVPHDKLAWHLVGPQHGQMVRNLLAKNYSPATVNRNLSGLRGTLKQAWKLRQMSAESYHQAKDIDHVSGNSLPAGRALSGDEIEALFEACWADLSTAGYRDAAILSVLRTAGLRRAEICKLKLEDYEKTPPRLTVRGKGNKKRVVPVADKTSEVITAWLGVRGRQAGALFSPIRKNGSILNRMMYPEAIFTLLRKRAAQAGVKDVSPHDFRRTFAGDLLDGGADIVTVQRLMGHASPITTSNYDRRGEETKRKAIELLDIPENKT